MTTTETTPATSSKPKPFVPIENSPETLTALLQHLSPSSPLTFHDILSLTDPYLLSPSLPRPILALILCCPASVYNAVRASDSATELYTSHDEKVPSGNIPVLHFKQTIPGSCGLIALLHAVCNGAAASHITAPSPLAEILHAAVSLCPASRARLLESRAELAAANEAVAVLGESSVPERGRRVGRHFVCFVKVGGRLWELDGGAEEPVDRGWLAGEDGVLSARGCELGVGRFLEREGGERCSVVGMGVGMGTGKEVGG